jgi:hypothetical protein
MIRVERVKTAHALSRYKETLERVRLTIEGEPPSSTMMTEAKVDWHVKPVEIGVEVYQRHIGRVRPEMHELTRHWMDCGAPFPSGGGLYGTIPNKSYEKIVKLAQFPELRDAVINLGIQDNYANLLGAFAEMRFSVSRQMLDMVPRDPEIFSRGNETAGTGVVVAGLRLTRAELAANASRLEFLLHFAYWRTIIFAATQIAELPGDQVWMIVITDNRIRGALAGRSDFDVLSQSYDGEFLTLEGKAQTRQAAGDGTGVLANAASEKRHFGISVTNRFIQEYKEVNLEYPFTDREFLWDIWATPVKPNETGYVIGEDFGLVEPVKAGADNLLSRAFTAFPSGKVLPEMTSGSAYTTAQYLAFQNHFARKTSGRMLSLGDDMNLKTRLPETEEVFWPYIKVKSTKPETNDKKILGWWVRTDEQEATFAVIPRVIKTLSSASKRGSYWGETLSNLGPKGMITMVVPEATQVEIGEQMETIKKFLFWRGPESELLTYITGLWERVSEQDLNALSDVKDDLKYRLGII